MPSDAFSATFSDWKLIRTRKVVQIVLEVPIEAADHAYKVLGGMPNPASEIWVGVARFKPGTEVVPNNATSRQHKNVPASEDSTTPARARTPLVDMPASQQAGILCGDKAFQKFLGEAYGYNNVSSADGAARIIRELCHIESRSELSKPGWSAERWRAIADKYHAWMREPSVVP